MWRYLALAQGVLALVFIAHQGGVIVCLFLVPVSVVGELDLIWDEKDKRSRRFCIRAYLLAGNA